MTVSGVESNLSFKHISFLRFVSPHFGVLVCITTFFYLQEVFISLLNQDLERCFSEHLKQENFSTSCYTGGIFNKSLLNGSNGKIKVKEAYEKYQKLHLPTISESARQKKIYRMDRFLLPIMQMKMAIFTPQFVAHLIQFWKVTYEKHQIISRFNWDKELSDVRSFLNWYRDTLDFKFQQPVKPFHRKLSVMKEIPFKKKIISPEEIKLFLSKLSSIYQDFALMQLFCAARVGEIAGIQKKNIDLKNRRLTIKEVLIWINGVPKEKSLPKNGRPRVVHINDTMAEVIERRLKQSPTDSPFLFSRKTKLPFRYNQIGAAYNKAWKKAGLTEYSGTHLLRYGGSQLCRSVMNGSLEAVKAVSGHVSDSMARKYSEVDLSELNRDAVTKCEEHFNQIIVPQAA